MDPDTLRYQRDDESYSILTLLFVTQQSKQHDILTYTRTGIEKYNDIFTNQKTGREKHNIFNQSEDWKRGAHCLYELCLDPSTALQQEQWVSLY